MAGLRVSSADMVRAARARITEIDAPELINMMNDPDVVIVDLRDIRERQRSGYIPGSFHAPRGMIDAAHLREGFSTWEKHGGPVEFPEKKD